MCVHLNCFVLCKLIFSKKNSSYFVSIQHHFVITDLNFYRNAQKQNYIVFVDFRSYQMTPHISLDDLTLMNFEYFMYVFHEYFKTFVINNVIQYGRIMKLKNCLQSS